MAQLPPVLTAIAGFSTASCQIEQKRLQSKCNQTTNHGVKSLSLIV